MRVAIRRDIGRRPGLAVGVRLLLPILLSLGVGCASLPPAPERAPSTAFDQPESTAVGAAVGEAAAGRPGWSGFSLLRTGREALSARVFLTEMAERSLDLQYYIFKGDTAGSVMAERLLRAADRGVRVRLLLDDNNLAGHDPIAAALDAHPNVEVRIFNPFAHRESHGFDFAIDFGRVNHRAHNKIFVADGAVAILGGRNIGDDYFGLSAEANFRDLDVAAVGPVVGEIAAGFDGYWNSDWAYPVAALVERQAAPADLERLRTGVRAKLDAHPCPYPLDGGATDLRAWLGGLVAGLVWAQARVVADEPGELTRGRRGEVAAALVEQMAAAEREILVESAYFVHRKAGVEAARRVCEAGVRVRVLTNSLASNDVMLAHAGYEKHRKGLLKAGVELHELRPDARTVSEQVALEAAGAITSLHTKAVVLDRESVFIGSFNLDLRSAELNTEVALLISSPELAVAVAAFMDEGAAPASSFRVVLGDDGDLVWIAEDEDGERRWTHEPETGGWARFSADLVRLLPIQSQL